MENNVSKILKRSAIVESVVGLILVIIGVFSNCFIQDNSWIMLAFMVDLVFGVCYGLGELIQIAYEIKQEIVNIRLGKGNETLVDRFSKGGRL